MPYQDVINKLTDCLKDQGFGIITSIDMQDIFRQKLQHSFRNYNIFGACNPEFAYKAISLESHVGLMLPCNIVVQEHENGEIEISAINPMETMSNKDMPTQMAELAAEVSNRLRTAVDNVHHPAKSKQHNEALPTDTPERK